MIHSNIDKYDYIDALRGIAVLGVILVHSSQSVEPNSPILFWFMKEGSRGVQLFYVASALTLCMSWFARSSHEKSSIRDFYIRRFFRIAPMFYIGILVYTLLNGFSPAYWAPNGIDWWFIPVTATFLHGFHPETITSVVPGGWSIAVEMNFYLILPFLLQYIKSKKSCLLILFISLVLSGLNMLIVPHIFTYPVNQQYLIKNFVYLNFLGQLPVFIIGIYGYLIICDKYDDRSMAIYGVPIFFILMLAFLYPAFGFKRNLFTDILFIMPHHFIAGGLFVVFALLLGRWPINLLVNKLTKMLGKLSFSMYLTHFAVLIYFSSVGFSGIFQKSNASSLLHFLCVVIVSAIVSLFFYKYIEKPGIKFGKLIIDNLDKPKIVG